MNNLRKLTNEKQCVSNLNHWESKGTFVTYVTYIYIYIENNNK